MGPNHRPGPARSNYRQARITFTQESTGRLSMSLYAKGLTQGWNEHACLDRWVVDWSDPILTMDDVLEVVVHALCERRLPGI